MASSSSASANPYDGYKSPSLEDDDLIDPDDATLDDLDDPLHPTTTNSSRAPLTGNISSSTTHPRTTPTSNYLTSSIPGEDRLSSNSTIDEPVWHTLRRDLLAVWSKMREVLYPKYIFGGSMIDNSPSLRAAYRGLREGGFQGVRSELQGLAGRVADVEGLVGEGGGGMSGGVRDWDLWGPLLFALALSILLSFSSQPSQKELVFSGVFTLIWLGEALVTLQIILLGGNISFAQSICIIGYTLFPLVIAALLSVFNLYWVIKVPVYLVLVGWSMAAGISILGGSGVVKGRVALAVYPLGVFYLGLGGLCFIS